MISSTLANYTNGGYAVTVHVDGTLARVEQETGAPPLLPEQLEMKVTSYCEVQCAWCHERSTPQGIHADPQWVLDYLAPLPAGVEVIFAGGDPLSHPGFEKMVKALSERGILPSVTIHGKRLQRHLKRLKAMTSQGHLFGVGVTYAEKMPAWDYSRMVLHLIAGIHPPEVLDDQPQRKVLLKGYRHRGRGIDYLAEHHAQIETCLSRWQQEIFWLAKEHHVSFDPLAVEQIDAHCLQTGRIDCNRRHLGETGEFSMYVDAVSQRFAATSQEQGRCGCEGVLSDFRQVLWRS